MGKNKKRLRAQRKFAQGAFIPPQNHTSTTVAMTLMHASHRAVNAPGPVMLNYCSAKDILTRMSIGRAHQHDNWQPVVRLEYDCGSTTQPPESNQRKKIKTKKIKPSNSEKKYALRNRQKSFNSSVTDKRRVSVSDSGEDTPLSFLTTREDTKESTTVVESVVSASIAKPPNSHMPIPEKSCEGVNIKRTLRKRHVGKTPEPSTNRLMTQQKRRYVLNEEKPLPTSSLPLSTTTSLLPMSTLRLPTSIPPLPTSTNPPLSTSTLLLPPSTSLPMSTPLLPTSTSLLPMSTLRLPTSIPPLPTSTNPPLSTSTLLLPPSTSLPMSTPLLPTSTPRLPASTPLLPTSTPPLTTSTSLPPKSNWLLPTITPLLPTSTPPLTTSTSLPPKSTRLLPTSTPLLPTSTPLLTTSTSLPPKSTRLLPTSTPPLTTSTSLPPKSTRLLPTSTPLLPTSTPPLTTSTSLLPTSTPPLTTSTSLLPTSTSLLPTSTPLLPTSTPLLPTSTLLLPASTPPLPTSTPPLSTSTSLLPTSTSPEPVLACTQSTPVILHSQPVPPRSSSKLISSTCPARFSSVLPQDLQGRLHNLSPVQREFLMPVIASLQKRTQPNKGDYPCVDTNILTSGSEEPEVSEETLKRENSEEFEPTSCSIETTLRAFEKNTSFNKLGHNTRSLKTSTNFRNCEPSHKLIILEDRVLPEDPVSISATQGASTLRDPSMADNKPTRKSRTVAPNNKVSSGDSRHFKLPNLPVFRNKQVKNGNCPTRALNELQELLNKCLNNKPRCNNCKRCELLEKYKKVVKKLPISEPDEPDILDTTPGDVYEFESDDEGFKCLRRGRELVRNVLTTKRLPIWLSNLQMNLKKTMFQDEHKLGTLMRTLTFNKNDTTDAMVSKVITRLDYLSRCIIEDKKELDLEKSRRRLRSAKQSSVPIGRKALLNRKKPKVIKTFIHKSVGKDKDRTSIAKAGYEAPAEAELSQVSQNERHMVLCLTPLEKMAEQERATAAAFVNSLNEINTTVVHCISPTLQQTSNIEQDIDPLLLPIEEDEIIISDSDDQPSTSGTKTAESSVCSDLFKNFPDIINLLSEDESTNSDSIKNIETGRHVSQSLLQGTEELVYRPTPKEFKDPILYIQKIQKKAAKFGICKIIPPEGFHVPCHLDNNSIFSTDTQYLGRLYQRWGSASREMVMIQTCAAMLAQAKDREQFSRAPLFDGVEMDLVKLYHTVHNNGGIQELFAHSEKWSRIVEEMKLVSPRGKPDHKKLEKLYCKHVLPYESLSHSDRHNIKWKVDQVWSERSKSAMRRVQRPLHYQRKLLGNTASDDEEDPDLDEVKEIKEIQKIAGPSLDKIEDCTAKGRSMNISSFRRISDQIRAMRLPSDPAPSTLDIEEEYWQILSLGNEHVAVLSAFIDTSVDDLGHTTNPNGPGGSHPWNLKRLSENPRNILSSLDKTLSVTVPTLCLNQLYSTNCWHMDPHKLSWVDFMHQGTTKIWYAVSEADAPHFRRTMEQLLPTTVQNKGIWLASDTTMVPPGMLVKNDVSLSRLEQQPGEFIVVFPGAYASSIATGMTISESVYFENRLWLKNIDSTFQQMRHDCEPAMFSNTLLLMRIACDSRVDPDVLPQVHFLLKTLIDDEIEARQEAGKCDCEIILDQSGRQEGERKPLSWQNQEECFICREPLVLSKTVRFNDHRSLMCLNHGIRMYTIASREERAECGPPPVTLLYSKTELYAITKALECRMQGALQLRIATAGQ